MEEKQKKTTKATNKTSAKVENKATKQNKTLKQTTTKKEGTKRKTDINDSEEKKQTTAKEKSKKTNSKKELDSENKKTPKTIKKESTTTRKKKEVKSEQQPTLKNKQDKKEENIDVSVTKKEETKKPATKSTKKETKHEEKQQEKTVEKTEKKKKKQYIDITLGSILAVIIIIALIFLNIKLVKQAYNAMDTTDAQSNGDGSIKEIGHELEKDNELVTSIIERITFAPSVTASIYDTKKFEENNIPNTLKLRIAWSLVKGENKLQSVNENNETVETIEQKVMQQSIKNIFGSNAEYKDEQFYNTNVSLFSTYAPNKGMIYYENGYYTNAYTKEAETKLAPFIYQEVEKVVKYSSEIEVYVKAAYIDTLGDVCMIYKDLENGKLSRRILQIDVKELLGETTVNYSTGEGTISINENKALDNIRKKLNTYKYTLRLDHSTGEFCLSSFEEE